MGDRVTSAQTRPGVCLGIANIRIGIASGDMDLTVRLGEDMQAFSVESTNPDLSLEAHWLDPEDAGNAGRRLFDSGGVWQLYFKDNSYRFHCHAPAFGKIPYKVACISRDFSLGRVFMHRPFFVAQPEIYPLQYPLDELLVLHLLSRGLGVEVHACGVADAGRGYLFVGHSGSGKTTMAKLWEKEFGVAILSDDRIILRQEEGKIWMYGTPWHGEANLASPSRVPLQHIFFIRHGQANSLISKAGAEAAALLFSSSFPVFYNPDALEFTIDFYGRAANAVPCSELSVVPDREVVDFIRRHSTN